MNSSKFQTLFSSGDVRGIKMTYLSHLILFVLALIATFFKGSRTDENGNTAYSDYGFPLLTKAGKVILILLTLSFLTSLYTTWRSDDLSENRERTLQTQLNDVRKELQRTSSPIQDMLVSFDVYVPLTNEYVLGYRKRLIEGLREYERKHKTSLSDNMLILPDTGLLPDLNYEQDAFMLLNCIRVTLNIYKKRIDPSDYDPHGKPDLSFSITVFVTRTPDVPEDANQIKGLFCNAKEFNGLSIRAIDIPVPPNKLDRTDQISSVNDLGGTQVVISLDRPFEHDSIYLYQELEVEGLGLKVSGRDFEFTRTGFDNLRRFPNLRFYSLRERRP